jgi:hypothetical protein
MGSTTKSKNQISQLPNEMVQKVTIKHDTLYNHGYNAKPNSKTRPVF